MFLVLQVILAAEDGLKSEEFGIERYCSCLKIMMKYSVWIVYYYGTNMMSKYFACVPKNIIVNRKWTNFKVDHKDTQFINVFKEIYTFIYFK